MRSAAGFSGMLSMFSSMISMSQPGGDSAARVARPSGGFTVRFPGSIESMAHLKLQKLSGKRGLINRSFILRSPVGRWLRHSGQTGEGAWYTTSMLDGIVVADF